MRHIFLAYGLTMLLLVSNASSQEQKNTKISFPLPTREMRLMEEARDPQTPISHLLELAQREQPQQVRKAAAYALGERAGLDVLPELEKLRYPAQGVSNDEITKAIEQIRIRQGMEKPTDPKTQADVAVRHLQANPVSQQDYEQGDYDKFRDYGQQLLVVAQTGDTRALEFMEKYFSIFHNSSHATDNPIDNDKDISENNSSLEEAYWDLKLRGMTLQQKLAMFVSVGSDPNQTTSAFFAMENALLTPGTSIVPFMTTILLDKKSAHRLREAAAGALMRLHDPKATDVLVRSVNDSSMQNDLRSLIMDMLAHSGHPVSVAETLQVLEREGGTLTRDNWERVTPALWRIEILAKAGIDKQKLETAILPYLKSGSSTAAMVAREVGGEASVEPLINIVKNPKAPTEESRMMVKSDAITSLGFIGQRIDDKDSRLLMFLIDLSDDKDPLTRIPAVQALSRTGKQLVVPVLLDLIKKENDHSALWFEVSGIYRAGGATAVQALQELKQFAQENQNAWLLELTEEGLLRLEREKRTGEVGQVATAAR